MSDEKPGLAPSTKILLEKVITWTVLAVFLWIIVLGVIAGTVVFVNWVNQWL